MVACAGRTSALPRRFIQGVSDEVRWGPHMVAVSGVAGAHRLGARVGWYGVEGRSIVRQELVGRMPVNAEVGGNNQLGTATWMICSANF